MKCIPGGSFVMGNPNDFGGTTPRDGNQVVESTSAQPEHLVALRSFAMDTDEMSAQNYYALRQLHPELPLPGTQGLDSSANQSPFCHYYGSDIDATSEWPLNCVSWQLAGQICAAQGKRLPTEAEWEYVAGNGIEETRFAWGNDENICAHSIVGRGWLQNEPNGTYTGPAFGDSRCRLSSANKLLPWGPQPGGHPQDVGSFGVRNLSGNMKEWLEDRFGAYEGPCWRGTVPGRNWLDNPVCRSAETGASDTFSARGGWWAELALSASVSQRDAWRGLSGGYIYGHMTVRCAKDL